MNKETYNQVIDSLTEKRKELRELKGQDYTRGTDDQFSNFKRHAEGLGLTHLQVWSVYASKHWDAIMSYVKNGQVESEAIEGRVEDLLNYLELFYGMVVEAKGDESKQLRNIIDCTPDDSITASVSDEDETVTTVDNEYPATPEESVEYKIGDSIEYLGGGDVDTWFTVGYVYEILEVEDTSNPILVNDDEGDGWWLEKGTFKKVTESTGRTSGI